MIYMVLKKSVRAKEQLNEARILGLREAIVAIFCDKPEIVHLSFSVCHPLFKSEYHSLNFGLQTHGQFLYDCTVLVM
jgi:hypothetical protein